MTVRERMLSPDGSSLGCLPVFVDPPSSLCASCRKAGAGILLTAQLYHREHPHSAYLHQTYTDDGKEYRQTTLVLPKGSLKRTQAFENGLWKTQTPFCMKTGDWEKLLSHGKDMRMVSEPARAVEVRRKIDGDGLWAALTGAPPWGTLCREFARAEACAQARLDGRYPDRAMRRVLAALCREALTASLSCAPDLLVTDSRLDTPWPETLEETLAEDFHVWKTLIGNRRWLALCASGDTTLRRALKGNAAIVTVPGSPGELSHLSGPLYLPEGWHTKAESWIAACESARFREDTPGWILLPSEDCAASEALLTAWRKDSPATENNRL